MKTVLSSQALCHAWAHQTQAYGRNAGNSTSFDGPVFRSYQTAIARIIEHKGRKAYVVDQSSFSNTTGKHHSHVRHAIPEMARTFIVWCGKRGQSLAFTPQTLRDYYLILYRAAPSTSRYKHIRARDLVARVGHLTKAIEVCEFFGLPTKRLEEMRAKHQTALEMASVVLNERADTSETRRSNRDARAAELRAMNDAERAPLWLNGESVHLSYDWPVMLRAKDDVMQTSRGTSVPLTDAKRLYDFVSKVRAKAQVFSPESVGNYRLDSVNDSGVVVGCHRVSWTEVDRFAGVMGWASAPIVNA